MSFERKVFVCQRGRQSGSQSVLFHHQSSLSHNLTMSLGELYTLTKLPRVSNVDERSKTTRNCGPDELHIGISGASISNYVLKPSPKLVWSHAIPPNTTVTTLENFGNKYFAGLFTKSKKEYTVQIIEKLENDSKLLKEISMASRVLNINAMLEGSFIVVTEQSIICFDANYEQQWEVKSLYTAVFSDFIENNVILTVEVNKKKNILNFKLTSPNGQEINSKIVESTDKLNNLHFTYTDGVLYQYFNNNLKLYNIPHFQDFKTLSLSTFNIKEPKSKLTMASPCKDRLLIAQDNDIYLINTNFNFVLSHISTPKSKVEISFLEHPMNNSYRATRQLFGVVLRGADLCGFNYSLDSNTLRDALGKQFNSKATIGNKFKDIPSIFEIKDTEFEISKLLESDNFDNEFLEFLQVENDYYTEKDRVVDFKFISRIVQHVFSLEELPERSLTYLLTHPLFPTVDNLLSKLRSKPRLVRQAVVTANISIKELLNELNTTENDEIFKDVIARLLEFPKDKLTFKDLDNFKIVERIINLNYGYELISLLIDASGLFTWNDELIEKLQKTLNRKVEALSVASKTLAVVEQAEVKINSKAPPKRIPVYSIEKLTI